MSSKVMDAMPRGQVSRGGVCCSPGLGWRTSIALVRAWGSLGGVTMDIAGDGWNGCNRGRGGISGD